MVEMGSFLQPISFFVLKSLNMDTLFIGGDFYGEVSFDGNCG